MSRFVKIHFCSVLAAILLCGCGNFKSNFIPDSVALPTQLQEPTTVVTQIPTEPETVPVTLAATEPEETFMTMAPLQVHFIDVGQADAILAVCDGETMLIDGGNVADSNLLYSYLEKHEISHLDYVIGTHAHEDHIGGIAGALTYATVNTVFCPTTSYSSKAFENFSKAVSDRQTQILVPSVNTAFDLGSAHAEILAVNAASGTNNSSMVLKLTHGDVSFLFMADAEQEVEHYLEDTYGAALDCTVLKVGHHGSSTSSSYGFLWHAMPDYAVISVGKDNSYDHPEISVLSRLRDSGAVLYRTDMQGDIVALSDGADVWFSVSRNAGANTYIDLDKE